MNLPIFGAAPGSFSPSPSFAPSRSFFSPPHDASVEPVRSYDEERERPAQPPSAPSVAAFGSGKPVCVRLCDGSFFPTASVSGGDAACAAQCPDSPTALYTMSTDRIEDAVSSTGKPYSALPVAKRYQTSFESTCACHRDSVASRAKELSARHDVAKGRRRHDGRRISRLPGRRLWPDRAQGLRVPVPRSRLEGGARDAERDGARQLGLAGACPRRASSPPVPRAT